MFNTLTSSHMICFDISLQKQHKMAAGCVQPATRCTRKRYTDGQEPPILLPAAPPSNNYHPPHRPRRHHPICMIRSSDGMKCNGSFGLGNYDSPECRSIKVIPVALIRISIL